MARIAHTPYYLVTFTPELGLSFNTDGHAYEMRVACKHGVSRFQVRHAMRMPPGELLSALDYAHSALEAMQ